jgi:hypothetical protein
VRLI